MKHGVRGSAVFHVLLDAEVVDRESDVQLCGETDGRNVSWTVESRTDLVLRSEVHQLAQGRDAAEVRCGRTHVVDQLLGDQPLEVPDRVEHLTDRERRR